MVKSLSLNIDGKTYQVEAIRPGVLAIDGEVVNVEVTGSGVEVDGQSMPATLEEGFAIVGGKLYETEWQVS